jgi:hypothetical protein
MTSSFPVRQSRSASKYSRSRTTLSERQLYA